MTHAENTRTRRVSARFPLLFPGDRCTHQSHPHSSRTPIRDFSNPLPHSNCGGSWGAGACEATCSKKTTFSQVWLGHSAVGRVGTHLGEQSARVAVQFVVQTPPPERGRVCTTVCALALHSARSRVAVAGSNRARCGCGSAWAMSTFLARAASGRRIGRSGRRSVRRRVGGRVPSRQAVRGPRARGRSGRGSRSGRGAGQVSTLGQSKRRRNLERVGRR